MCGIGLVHLAQETECGGLRVERRAIVKVDALTKFESVGEALRADCPGSRQTGLRLRGAVFEADEAFADVDENFDRFAVVHVGGVELLRIGSPGEDQGPRFRLVRALTACKCEDEREEREPFHRGMVADRPPGGKQASLTRMAGGLTLAGSFQGIYPHYLNE